MAAGGAAVSEEEFAFASVWDAIFIIAHSFATAL